jgi:hypothetical protein
LVREGARSPSGNAEDRARVTTEEPRVSAKVTKIGRIGCDGLNELAEQFFRGDVLLSRRPSSPSFWFFNLAIDANAHTFGPSLRALLSPEALALIGHVNLAAFDPPYAQCDETSPAHPWCSCVDRAFAHGATCRRSAYSMWPGHYWSGVECWPCALGEHEQCADGCSTVGELHFPETVMRRAA